jgi:hypothetical protein
MTANFGAFDLSSSDELFLIESDYAMETPIRVLTPDGEFVREFGNGLENSNGILVMSVSEVP